MKDNLTQKIYIPVLIAVSTALVAGLVVGQGARSYFQKKSSIEQKRLVNDAVDGCLKAGSAKWTDQNNGAEITALYQPAFDKCMKDKGL